MGINDYLNNSLSQPLVDFSTNSDFSGSIYKNTKDTISKYLNRNLESSKKVQNEILDLKSGLQSYTKEIEYKTGDRKVDRNEILDFSNFNSRLSSFMQVNAVPQAQQMRAPTQEELDRVIWEDG